MSERREARALEPDDLYRLKILHDVQLSPDGKAALCVVAWIDAEREEEYLSLWVVTLADGATRLLTEGPFRDSEPCWSPDGARVAFVSNRGGTPQLYVIAATGGAPEPLTWLEQGVGGGSAWSPDGAWLAFSAVAGRGRAVKKPYRLTRHLPRLDGLGYLDEAIQDIYVVPASGGEARRLTADALHNSGPAWSPDSRELAYTAALEPDSFRSAAQVRCVTLQGESRSLTGAWGYVEYGNSLAWTPDGAGMLFIGQPFARPAGSKNDLWRVGRDGGEPECRTPELAVGVGGYLQPDFSGAIVRNPRTLVAADGRSALVQVVDGGETHIYRVALAGAERWEAVIRGERTCVPVGLSGEQLLFVESTLHQPTELRVSAPDGTGERRVTRLNDELLATRARATAERLHFPSSDGQMVEGWVIKPPMGDAPYPTVLYIHGGPHAGFGHVYSFDFQMLAGAGYAVLLVNQRGSTGYGDAFATAIVGDWGHLDYDDSMAGVEVAIERGLADEERLGCCGLSAGGFLTAWIVGHTGRFRAAVAENPLIDWVSFYGVSDIGPRFASEELGGHPHEIPEVYRRCSPLSYAHHCRTPTLLVQGEEDYRCPAEQAEQFYRTLKACGCPVEMLRLPGSSHLGTIRGAPPIRRAQNEALLAWMDRYVRG